MSGYPSRIQRTFPLALSLSKGRFGFFNRPLGADRSAMPKRDKKGSSAGRRRDTVIAQSWQPSRRRVAALLFLGLTALYFCNFRMRGAGDSLPTRVLPFSILREGNLDLNEFTWAESPQRPWPYYIHAEEKDGTIRFYSVSTIATAVLVTPLYVPAAAWLAWNDISYNDSRARVVMVLMEKLSAAILTALSAAVLYFALSGMATWRWALALTLVYALGTSTWAISSQALWAHALSELCMAALLAIFVRGTHSPATVLGAALICAVMIWNRPQMAIFAGVAFVYAVSRDRRTLLPLALAASFSGALLIGYNLWALGSVFGGYGGVDHFSNPLLAGLAGLTVSPNRGLFIYTPIALFSLWGVVAVWRTAAPSWLRMMTIGLALHVLMYSKFDEWWAGYSYGPRYFTDVQPLLIVLLVHGLLPLWRFSAIRGLAVALATYGIFVQAIGVYAADDGWNRDPVSVDAQPERVWDWNDTQIGRALGNGFRGFELLPVMIDVFRDPVPAELVELSSDDLASRVELLAMPTEIEAGEVATVRLRVTNLGGSAWPMFSGKDRLDIRHLVFVVQAWTIAGRQLDGIGEVVLLPQNLAPGESCEIEMPLVAPMREGSFDIEFRVTQAIDSRRGIPSPQSATARLRVVRR